MSILIHNGHVLDPSTGRNGIFDILIVEDKIQKIGKNINEEADQLIDATGKYISPGFIDLHVHLRDPGLEYKETIKTGSRAAAHGGFTTICTMPNTIPVMDSKDAINLQMERAQTDSVVHILPIGAVTKEQSGEYLADIEDMVQAGAVAISEDGKSVMNTALYREGMLEAKRLGIPVFAHCEDKSMMNQGVMNAGKKAEALGLRGIVNAVEDVIVARDILMAKDTGVQLHLCHCSTRDSVRLVKLAKEEGLPVTAEVCPHHFSMSDEDISKDDGNYKMNPPLRAPGDVLALKEALRDGVADVIATDHAPHSAEEKNCSIAKAAFGIVGLETALALTVTELVKKDYLSLMQLVEKMSCNPARILGIDKGSLQEGKIADVVIFDVTQEYAIDTNAFESMGRNTPFNGKLVRGRAEYTIVDGAVVYQR